MVEHIRVIIAISALILGACGGTDPISDVLEDTTLPDVGIDEGQTNPDPGSPTDPGNPTPDPSAKTKSSISFFTESERTQSSVNISSAFFVLVVPAKATDTFGLDNTQPSAS